MIMVLPFFPRMCKYRHNIKIIDLLGCKSGLATVMIASRINELENWASPRKASLI